MADLFDDESGEFLVLINEEQQYSLWPAVVDAPAGWSRVGPRGKRSECLSYIDEHWIDMRPKSLREQMERDARDRATN
jgi:uncharacterized protein YbdZ (MbtH family)